MCGFPCDVPTPLSSQKLFPDTEESDGARALAQRRGIRLLSNDDIQISREQCGTVLTILW